MVAATCAIAQRDTRTDSLLNATKNLRFPKQTLQMPNSFKLTPKDSLLGKLQFFKYPGADSFKIANSRLLKNGITHSPVDHMPIASLPSNSRMPVYKLKKSDNMPGSNPPAVVAPVAPQK